MNFKRTALITLAALGLAASQPTLATTMTDNTGEALAGYAPLMFLRAESFTVATDQDYMLEDVQIKLIAPPTSGLFARIYSNSGSNPGTLLEQLSLGSFNPTSSLLAFASTGLDLTAGATYWVVVGGDPTGATGWDTTFSTNQTSVGNWSIGNNNRLSFNSGASWGTYGGVEQMAIDATPAAVPEPTTLALLGLGAVGMRLTRRRRAV